jgi:peptide methionine sulfoxide reductase msrA/msrB
MYKAFAVISAPVIALILLQVISAQGDDSREQQSQSNDSVATQAASSDSTTATTEATQEPAPATHKTAVVAGGCFWCTETDFEKCPGVIDVVSGYSGGTTENPNYHTYHDGRHTECSLVTYDPAKVTYAGIVEWLIKHIDPTDGNGQFADRGEGYMPIIFYESESEKADAERILKLVEAKQIFKLPLQVAVRERSTFWPAEEYHQDYHTKEERHYKRYRNASQRDDLIDHAWGKSRNVLEFEGSLPAGVIQKSVKTK